MKSKILTGWNFMRVLRLIISAAVVLQSFILKDIMFGIAGFLIAGMAIFNIGCCGTGNCNVTKKYNDPKKEISYEEVV
ncbi:MAG: hypothetical protein ABIN36_17685 [Ferruginibacter sp.]